MNSRTLQGKNRKRFMDRCVVYLLTVALCTCPVATLAQSNEQEAALAGRVVSVIGEVIARNSSGSDRQLQRRAEVFVGDTIFTAPGATAQIRMVDEAIIALRESTEFSIVAYEYEENPNSDESALELIRGGFRTITGAIGEQNRNNYRTIIDEYVTIGIRGTDYEVYITAIDEILTGVFDGGTTISNDLGSLDLGIGADYDFAIVDNPQTPPQGLLLQPVGLGNLDVSVAADVDADGDDSNDQQASNGAATQNNDGDNQNVAATTATGNQQDTAANSNALNASTVPTPPQVDLDPPSSEQIAQVPGADTAGNSVVESQREETVALIQVNPNETNGDGALNCAAGSSCIEVQNGQALLAAPPTDTPDDGADSNDTGNNTADSGDSSATGDNDNTDSTGSSGSDNANGDSTASDGTGGGSDGVAGDGSASGGDADNTDGNSSGSDSGSGDSASGSDDDNTSGDSASGGSAGDSTGGDDSDGGSAAGSDGDASGNDDNSGNDSNAGSSDVDNGSTGGNDSSGNDSGTAGSGDDGNSNDDGTAGSGDDGNSNDDGTAGSGDDGNGNGNDDGTTGGDDDGNGGDDGTTGGGDDGSSGGGDDGSSGGGDDGSSGGGSSDPNTVILDFSNIDIGSLSLVQRSVLATIGISEGAGVVEIDESALTSQVLSVLAEIGVSVGSALTGLPTATLDQFEINWGKWNSTTDSNQVAVQSIGDGLVRVSTDNFQAELVPTPIANMKGSHTYQSGLASAFIGTGSGGDVSSLVANLDVNFDTGAISDGNLQVLSGEQAWSVDFNGLVQGGFVELNALGGQLSDPGGVISTDINANLGGAFTGNNAEAFVGGFDLIDSVNELNFVEGLYTIER